MSPHVMQIVKRFYSVILDLHDDINKSCLLIA